MIDPAHFEDSPAALRRPRLPAPPCARARDGALLLKLTLVGSIDSKRCPKSHALGLLATTGALPLTVISTEGDRTLFLERAPRDVGGRRVREALYATAGPVYYDATRRRRG